MTSVPPTTKRQGVAEDGLDTRAPAESEWCSTTPWGCRRMADELGRLARKHFSTGAHPAAETPFYIAAASVSARGHAQCVWSHESSISSSYFPLELRCAISHESGLRKLHCSRLLRASCSLQAAARKCSVQVALRKCSEQVAPRKCSAPVAPRKRFAHALCASWSVQVALRLLCASCSAPVLWASCSAQGLCASCSAQALCACALCKLVCASCSAQVLCTIALCKLLCASCSAQVTLRKLLCASAAGAAGVCSAYYVCT